MNMSDNNQEDSGKVNRINPDRIEFMYDHDEGQVEYTEYLDCSERDLGESDSLEEAVRKDEMLFKERAAVNPHIDLVEVETTLEDEVEKIQIVMDQGRLEAVASLAGELLGFILEEDEDMFYNKFKPFVERAKVEKDVDVCR